MPTGSGKGLLMAHIVNTAKSNVLTVVRRRVIVLQTQRNYKKYFGIESGVIMSNRAKDAKNKSTICSIDTMSRRLDKSNIGWVQKKHKLVLIDECHDVTSESYKRFLWWMEGKGMKDFSEENFEKSKNGFNNFYLGFTATPFRIGKRTHSFFQSVIAPVTAAQLKDQGHLVPVRFFRPVEKMDLGSVKIDYSTGDYNNKQLMREVSGQKVIGDVVDVYKKHGENKRAICFAVNIEHSKLLAAEFNQAGIPAIHCDADHTTAERAEAILKLKLNEYKVLTNVNIFSTGLDCPWIEVEICARPSASEVLVVQQWGRVLRPSPGKDYAIIIDHGNNSSRFGLPFDDRQPELDDVDKENKKERDISGVKDCPQCFITIKKSEKVCPECGFDFSNAGKEKMSYDDSFVDGELEEVDKERTMEMKINKTYAMLCLVEYQRGYNNLWKFYQLFDQYGRDLLKYGKVSLPDFLKYKWIEQIKKEDDAKNKKNSLRESRVIRK